MEHCDKLMLINGELRAVRRGTSQVQGCSPYEAGILLLRVPCGGDAADAPKALRVAGQGAKGCKRPRLRQCVSVARLDSAPAVQGLRIRQGGETSSGLWSTVVCSVDVPAMPQG